jgi:hypothetical protein
MYYIRVPLQYNIKKFQLSLPEQTKSCILCFGNAGKNDIELG